MSIFNKERKETFLESLQESMLVHKAMKDRAEKLAEHLGISFGEAVQQLKAHLVRSAQSKRIKESIDSLLSESTSEEFCDKISDILLDEGIHGDIHKGLVGGVQKALQDHAAAVKKHGPDHPSTHEAAYRVKQAVDSVSDHLAKSGYNPQKRKVA